MSSPRLLLLFFASLGLYIAGDWSLPLIDRDEPRFAEASREMLQGGDFVVPYFNHQPRFDKPPLIYWLQDAAYELFGQNEFAARLPSGICAALTAVVIALWGARLYEPRVGWRAALIFGLCAQTIVHAHAAVADMAMIAASTASAWVGWNWLAACGVSSEPGGDRPSRASGKRWALWLAFWGLLAVGFLAKGPIAWVPIGMAGWTAAKTDRAHRPAALEWLLGVVLMLALVGLWGIPALLRTHGAYAVVGLGKHVVMRSVAPLEGHGARSWWSYAATFPFYLLTVWPTFFPWSLWLPAVAIALWRRRSLWRLEEIYLLSGIVLVFGIFTLSWTKLPHYILPAFPFMALLMGAWWRPERDPAFRWTAAGMAAGALVVALAILPLARPLFVSQRLYDVAAPYLARNMELATVSYQEPSLLWLFRKKIGGFETRVNWNDAEDWMNQPGPRVCVMPAAQVKSTFRNLDPAWRVVQAAGFDVANAHGIELAAVIKTGSGY
jgi:4-amino-4-deoxy-L-arabinose transferase-like glycosyltransferase